jgi:hypothetical protein
MAEQTETKDQAPSKEANGGSSNGGHKGAVRAAAIAAATGAAALAAKKAFSGRDQSSQGTQKSEKRSGGGDESMLLAMATSGWSAAKDSLLPFAEDAAGVAGDWVGRNGPEYVRETIVPRFISSFEAASKSSEQSD